jgi:hypothetical protein
MLTGWSRGVGPPLEVEKNQMTGWRFPPVGFISGVSRSTWLKQFGDMGRKSHNHNESLEHPSTFILTRFSESLYHLCLFMGQVSQVQVSS